MADIMLLSTQFFNFEAILGILSHFLFSTFAVWLIVRFLYYPKSCNRDYYFTFMLIAVSVFFLIYLLGGVRIKVGFALGLFAIFGIIRYRTESMPVREMTYLFVIIAMQVVNALSDTLSVSEIVLVNALFVIAVWVFERTKMNDAMCEKLVQYDRIDLIKPDCREQLIADLKERTGLDIKRVEVGGIDFLRDMAVLKIYYPKIGSNTVNDKLKLRNEDMSKL